MKKIVGILSICLVTGLVAQEINIQACIACHGDDWSKEAMGKSRKLSELSYNEILTSLKGYKSKTKEGKLARIMEGQIARFTECEIKEIAKIITK